MRLQEEAGMHHRTRCAPSSPPRRRHRQLTPAAALARARKPLALTTSRGSTCCRDLDASVFSAQPTTRGSSISHKRAPKLGSPSLIAARSSLPSAALYTAAAPRRGSSQQPHIYRQQRSRSDGNVFQVGRATLQLRCVADRGDAAAGH
jgi:hypothetical protein